SASCRNSRRRTPPTMGCDMASRPFGWSGSEAAMLLQPIGVVNADPKCLSTIELLTLDIACGTSRFGFRLRPPRLASAELAAVGLGRLICLDAIACLAGAAEIDEVAGHFPRLGAGM